MLNEKKIVFIYGQYCNLKGGYEIRMATKIRITKGTNVRNREVGAGLFSFGSATLRIKYEIRECLLKWESVNA